MKRANSLLFALSLGLCVQCIQSPLVFGESVEPVDQPVDSSAVVSVEQPADTPDVVQPLEEATLETAPPVNTSEPVKAKAVVVDIDSETLRYVNEKDVYVAEGDVHVVISEQNSEMIADKVTYDKNKQDLIAEGHVVIVRDGQKTIGTYARIDLTRQSALITDPITKLETVRVKAKQAFVNNDYLELENGKLILDGAFLGKKLTRQGQYRQQNDLNMAFSGKQKKPERVPTTSQVTVGGNDADSQQFMTEILDLSSNNDPQEAASAGKFFNLKVNDIEVRRGDDGIDEIDMKWPQMRLMDKFPVATLPQIDFAYEQETGWMEYLGPDIGFDQDMGGFYYGPGWDFKVGKGFIRMSPLVGYGRAARRGRGRSTLQDDGMKPSVGGLLHYQARNTRVDLGYTTSADQLVAFGEHKMFDGNTRVLLSANQNYNVGFLGNERPNAMAQVVDARRLLQYKSFDLDTVAGVGVARDEFFPTNNNNFFVKAKGPEPVTAGRAQIQLRVRNNKPLLQVSDVLSFGFEGQLAMFGYTTGDYQGVARMGPTMRVRLGDRWISDFRYLYGGAVGETPFVFDTYFRGRNNLRIQNAFRVNDYLTLGMMNDLNLDRDNAQDALAVGNQVFALVGPKDVKVRMAYDIIRRRTFFGVDFYPGSGDTSIDYDRMRIFQPQGYTTNPGDVFMP